MVKNLDIFPFYLLVGFGLTNKTIYSNPPLLQVTGKEVSSQRMWDVLRRAVQSGSYKKAYLASDSGSALYWESIFSPGASSAEGYRYTSAPSSPIKSPEFSFSGPGPPDESGHYSDEDRGATWKGGQKVAFNFPPSSTEESDFESSIYEEENESRRRESTQSPPIESVQLSPAPEEYYRIVPITPFTPYKKKREVTETSFSWKLPHTFTSRERDVVETLSQAYKQPRVVSIARPRYEPGNEEEPPPAKQRLFDRTVSKKGKDTKEQRLSRTKASKQRKTERKSRKGVFKKSAKLSPRMEPDGEPAEKLISSTRGKGKRSALKFRGKSSPKAPKLAFRRNDSGPVEGLSTEPIASELPEEEFIVEPSSRLPRDVRTRLNFPSVSTSEYLTPPMSSLQDFYSINRSQSDPSVDVEHFRNLGELSSEFRRTRSMSALEDEEVTDEDDQ